MSIIANIVLAAESLLPAIPPAIGVIILIVGLLYERNSSSTRSKSTKLWVILFMVLLVAAGALCVLGVISADLLAVLAFCLVTTLAGLLVSVRDELLDIVDELPPLQRFSWRAALRVAAFANAVGMAYLALEIPWNLYGIPNNGTSATIEVVYIAAILLGLWLLCGLHGGLPTLGVAAAAFGGFTQYLVLTLNHAPITPSDVLAFRTAAAVSGGYVYNVSSRPLLGIMCAVVGIAGLAFVRPMRTEKERAGLHEPASVAGRVKFGASIFAGAAVMAGILWALVNVNLYSRWGVGMDYWPSTIMETYSEQGFLPTLISAAQGLKIVRPHGYSSSGAAAIEEELAAAYDERADRSKAEAQWEAERPDIIVVMNETFADLSALDGLHAGYQGPRFFNDGLTGTLVRGALGVSVKGGGTCNSEFEFLTGNSFALLGAGKSPYAMYDFSGVDNLARQLADLGYGTCAIHPNLPSNWNRETVYEQMGFERFITLAEFADAPTFHNGVTDAATYDKIIEVLEESDGPQFIFDVTMQNHSSYDKGDIPANRLTHFAPSDFDDTETNAELNEYLSCIEASDADLERFIGQLEKLDRDVVLVFFGDHQPYFTDSYSDAIFGEDDGPEHQSRVYQTSYFIWANYDVEGQAQNDEVLDTSTGYLSSMLLERIGAPLSRYQKAKLQIQLEMPTVFVYGFRDAEGVWHSLKEGGGFKAYHDLELIQYEEFAIHVDG